MNGLGPTTAELAERNRKFIEEEGPWNNGGKQATLGNFGIAMTHDELAAKMGPAYQQMTDAGFVMVPKKWREDVYGALQELGEFRRKKNEEL
jgi:hypothetical protein